MLTSKVDPRTERVNKPNHVSINVDDTLCYLVIWPIILQTKRNGYASS